jgi:hypothetical protein
MVLPARHSFLQQIAAAWHFREGVAPDARGSVSERLNFLLSTRDSTRAPVVSHRGRTRQVMVNVRLLPSGSWMELQSYRRTAKTRSGPASGNPSYIITRDAKSTPVDGLANAATLLQRGNLSSTVLAQPPVAAFAGAGVDFHHRRRNRSRVIPCESLDPRRRAHGRSPIQRRRRTCSADS